MSVAAASLSLMPDKYPAQRPATLCSPPAHNNCSGTNTLLTPREVSGFPGSKSGSDV